MKKNIMKCLGISVLCAWMVFTVATISPAQEVQNVHKKFKSHQMHNMHEMQKAGSQTMKTDEKATVQGDPYPLDFCIVTRQKLGTMGDPVVIQHEGREFRFCCQACQKKFKESPQKFTALVDQEIIKDQQKVYPLETCLVSGEKLGGSMGEVVNIVHKNRLFRFCCQNCVNQFNKEPAAYWKKLDAAVIQKQKDAYPLKTCVVSGQKLGGAMGKPIDVVIANRLVRLCCEGCKKQLAEHPMQYLSKLSGKNTAEKEEAAHTEGHASHQDHSGHQH